jgi:hypothetical protein
MSTMNTTTTTEIEMTFDGKQRYNNSRDWCAERGIAMGDSEGSRPIGLKYGTWWIRKVSHIMSDEGAKALLDGWLWDEGGITTIRVSAPEHRKPQRQTQDAIRFRFEIACTDQIKAATSLAELRAAISEAELECEAALQVIHGDDSYLDKELTDSRDMFGDLSAATTGDGAEVSIEAVRRIALRFAALARI